MKSIHDALREKELQIAALQREVEILRAATRIVSDDRRQSSHRVTGVLSQPQMIRDVLQKNGSPLHVDKIAEVILKRFKVKLKRSEITSVIYRAIRGKKFFRKEGINTFGLVEWPVRRAGRSRR